MRSRPINAFFQYAFIVWLGMMLMLGQVFKLHMHVKQQHAGASEEISQLHIASTLHHEQNQTESHLQNQHPGQFSEIDISAESHVNKVEILVLAGLLFLVGALLFFNLRPGRVSNRFTFPSRRVSSLLYLVIPPLRAPPSPFAVNPPTG